jgi:hypothetical protein
MSSAPADGVSGVAGPVGVRLAGARPVRSLFAMPTRLRWLFPLGRFHQRPSWLLTVANELGPLLEVLKAWTCDEVARVVEVDRGR